MKKQLKELTIKDNFMFGAVMTMPGLPKVPAANHIDVTDDGKITGLF